MRKFALTALAAGLLAAALAPALAAAPDDDFQAIQKAVTQKPAPAAPGAPASGESKWFKLTVTDTRSGKQNVRITMPIRLVEMFARCAEDRHMRFNRHHCEVDLGEVLAELRKSAPQTVIEIEKDDSLVKVWFE